MAKDKKPETVEAVEAELTLEQVLEAVQKMAKRHGYTAEQIARDKELYTLVFNIEMLMDKHDNGIKVDALAVLLGHMLARLLPSDDIRFSVTNQLVDYAIRAAFDVHVHNVSLAVESCGRPRAEVEAEQAMEEQANGNGSKSVH